MHYPSRAFHCIVAPRGLATLVAAVLMTVTGTKSQAQLPHTVNFTVDPSRSNISVAGDLGGVLPLTEQSPGSTTTSLSGGLEVDFYLTYNFLTNISVNQYFDGSGDFVVLADQPGLFQPGGLPADVAVQIINIIPGHNATAAFRDIVLEPRRSKTPVSANGTFLAEGMGFFTEAGQLDYHVPGFDFSGTESLANFGNSWPVQGSLRIDGFQAEIHLPIASLAALETPLGMDLNLDLTGDIYATATLPMPVGPIQWAMDDGGNGHFYHLVQSYTYWDDARALAESLLYRGKAGHLVTINSAEENQFITDTFGDHFFGAWTAGKEDPAMPAGWSWESGSSTIDFFNWADGQPKVFPEPGPYHIALGNNSNEFGSEWKAIHNSNSHYFIIEYPVVPEPSSVVLALLGMLGIGLVGWRRRV